jgi:hypothetical protein
MAVIGREMFRMITTGLSCRPDVTGPVVIMLSA